jgi:hypothetical protein
MGLRCGRNFARSSSYTVSTASMKCVPRSDPRMRRSLNPEHGQARTISPNRDIGQGSLKDRYRLSNKLNKHISIPSFRSHIHSHLLFRYHKQEHHPKVGPPHLPTVVETGPVTPASLLAIPCNPIQQHARMRIEFPSRILLINDAFRATVHRLLVRSACCCHVGWELHHEDRARVYSWGVSEIAQIKLPCISASGMMF